MSSRIVLALASLALAGCGALSASDRLVTVSGRLSNADEHAYTAIASSSGSSTPCDRISSRAYRLDDSAAPGLQVVLERSLCFAAAARRSGEPSLCERVESMSTLWHDGSAYDQDRCRRDVAKGRGPSGAPRDLSLLMHRLGFESEDLVARCDGFLRDLGRSERERRQDAYVRCVQERPSRMRADPTADAPLCSGPFNRTERYADCVERRSAEQRSDPGAWPDDWVDRCRLHLRDRSLAQQTFDECVDRASLQWHRSGGDDGEAARAGAESRCRESAIAVVRRDDDWGSFGYCRNLAEPDPDTFRWRVARDGLDAGPDWVRLYADLLESGAVLARLDRLPNHALD